MTVVYAHHMSNRIAREATSAAPYAYQLHTVSRFRLVGESLAYAPSAQVLVEQAVAMGYVKAEAAPAVPVNGYPEGLPVRHGDTASFDTLNPEHRALSLAERVARGEFGQVES